MKKLQKKLMIWILCLCLCAGSTACGGGEAGNSKDVEVTKDEWLAAINSYPQDNYTFTYYTEKSYTIGIRVDGVLYQTGDSERGSSEIRWKEMGIYGYSSDRGVSDMLNGFVTVIEWSRERYDEFTFTDGVYFCKSISLPSETEETSFDCKDIKIEFSDKKLASVTFLWLQERIKCFCDAFGTTSVTPPRGISERIGRSYIQPD